MNNSNLFQTVNKNQDLKENNQKNKLEKSDNHIELLANYPNYEIANKLWKDCLNIINDNVSPQVYKTWFGSLKALNWENDSLTLQVPSQFFYEWLEEHYYNLLKTVTKSILGDNSKLLYEVVIEKNDEDSLESRTIKMPAFKTPPTTKFVENNEEFVTNLNPKYTLDNFVVGDSNQLAFSAAKAVSKNPGGTNFNPLFIYSNPGLGKSHLVQAIGNYIISQNPSTKVLYLNSEKFYSDFVSHIQSNNQLGFLEAYRKIDVLIIDDIQFLSGKIKTLDHFFYLFNSLHQIRKQIIITSDKSPKDLTGIDERLISRFAWGLTVDIQKPDFETKIEILKRKSQDDGLVIPQDILEYIAENINTSVRELEGTLIRLIAGVTLDRKELNINLAKEVVMGFNKVEPKPLTIDFIKTIVSDFYKIPIDLIESPTRKQEVALARQMSMYLTKKFTKLSLKSIGSGFGNRDHSTVLHSCTTIENYLDTDKKVNSEYQNLVNYIKKNSIIN